MNAKTRGGSSVRASRIEPLDALDFYPTPPWATRALIEFCIGRNRCQRHIAWEPACGEGHMARVLAEYFGEVWASDIYPYGFGQVRDFTAPAGGLGGGQWEPPMRPDWVITNPPFRLATEFARRALALADRGVALLCRLQYLESEDRERLFNDHPLTYLSPFSGRLSMVKGRLDPTVSSATAYAWFVWIKQLGEYRPSERLLRIPFAARSQLERLGDYARTGNPDAPFELG